MKIIDKFLNILFYAPSSPVSAAKAYEIEDWWKDAKDAYKDKLHSDCEWISITERKPDFGDHCLFVIETSIQYVVSGYVDEGDGETRFEDCSIADQYGDHIGYEADCISYWKPLELPVSDGE